MTNEEAALKIVIGKYIIKDMAKDSFWQMLIGRNTQNVERMTNAVDKALTALPIPDPFPKTDQEFSDLIFSWTFPVRCAVAVEFQDSLPK